MTLRLDPTRCAFLAMDFQNDILATTPRYGEKHLLETVMRVLDAARQTSATIVYITVSFRHDYADAPPHSPLFQDEKARGVMKAGSLVRSVLHKEVSRDCVASARRLLGEYPWPVWQRKRVKSPSWSCTSTP
jgi:nicotinamidase-related amidase